MLAHRLEPVDLEKAKAEFIALVRAEADEDFYAAFPQPFEQSAVSVFVAYTALSAHLRFKPQSLLARSLLG
jgi:hypothetical protein